MTIKQIFINSRTSGKFQIENINGRECLVTKVISIVGHSVMNGLFYGRDEVKASYKQLENIQSPAGHPPKTLSALHPLALNSHYVGAYVRNPEMIGDIVYNELVVDIAKAQESHEGTRIVNHIKAGKKVGVSTGGGGKLVIKTGIHNGKKFFAKVKNIVFDHLAILLDQEPAGDQTYVLNNENCDDVIFCNVNQTGAKRMSNQNTDYNAVEFDLSPLALDMRIAISNCSAQDLADAIQHKITVEEATKIVESSGMFVNSQSKDLVDEYFANADEFQKFKATKLARQNELIDHIIQNSEMTAEDLEGKGEDVLNRIAKSVTPKNTFFGNSGDKSGSKKPELQLLHNGA